MTNGSSTFSLMLLYTVILQIPTYSILYIHSECVWKLQNLQCITEVLSLSPPAPWDRVTNVYLYISLAVCVSAWIRRGFVVLFKVVAHTQKAECALLPPFGKYFHAMSCGCVLQ